MTATVEDGTAHSGETMRAGRPTTLRLRWVSVTEAARLLGISEVAVRKRVASHSLSGIRAGRGWKVLLVGETAAPADDVPSDQHPGVDEAASPDGEAEQVLVRTVEALNGLVRDLQRQSLALAAQVGYLQSQLTDAQNEMKLLAGRNEATVEHDPGGPSPAEYEAARQTIDALRAALAAVRTPEPTPRRRWRFWTRPQKSD